MLRAALFALLCLLAVSTVHAQYVQWIHVPPPASMAGMPILRIGSTFSMTGVNQVAGLDNRDVFLLAVALANERGGVYLNGRRHAIALQYLSDDSSHDLAYLSYVTLNNQVKATLANSTLPRDDDAKINGQPPLHCLFAPHFTDMTLPALKATMAQNQTLWTVGSSSDSIYPSYPYVWGNGRLSSTWLSDATNMFLQLTPKPKTAAFLIRKADTFANGNYIATKKQLEAAGVVTQFEAFMPTTLGAGLATDFTQWMNQQWLNDSFPTNPDIFILFSVNPLEMNVAADAMKLSGKAPGLAFYNQFWDETVETRTKLNGWIATFLWRPDNYIKSSLPGVLFTDTNDYIDSMARFYPGHTITPLQVRESGAIESMFATLNVTKSLSAVDIREASLKLDGYTIFTKMKYDPVIHSGGGSNPGQSLIFCQAIDTEANCFDKSTQIQYPYPWPWTLPPVPVSYSQTGGQFALMILGLIFAGFLFIIILLFINYRGSRVLHASSTVMLGCTLLGSALVIVAAIVNVLPPNEVRCTLSSWFFNIGWTISLGSLFAKTFRLDKIFNARQFTKTQLTDGMLLLGLTILVAIDCIFLAIRTGTASYADLPNTQGCGLTPWSPVDRLGNDTEIEDPDKKRAWRVLNGFLIAVKGLVLLYGAFLCFRVRNLPSLYNESGFLAAVIYNTCVVSVFWLGIRYSFDFDATPVSLTLLESALMIFGVLVTCSLIFLPKFYVIRQQVPIYQAKAAKKLRKDQLNKQRLTTGGEGSGGLSPRAGAMNSPSPTNNSSAGVEKGVTLAAVREALAAHANELEANQRKAEREIAQLVAKIDEKRAVVRNTAQAHFQVQSERQYLDEFGAQLSETTLRDLVKDRTSSLVPSSDHQKVSGDVTAVGLNVSTGAHRSSVANHGPGNGSQGQAPTNNSSQPLGTPHPLPVSRNPIKVRIDSSNMPGESPRGSPNTDNRSLQQPLESPTVNTANNNHNQDVAGGRQSSPGEIEFTTIEVNVQPENHNNNNNDAADQRGSASEGNPRQEENSE